MTPFYAKSTLILADEYSALDCKVKCLRGRQRILPLPLNVGRSSPTFRLRLCERHECLERYLS